MSSLARYGTVVDCYQVSFTFRNIATKKTLFSKYATLNTNY